MEEEVASSSTDGIDGTAGSDGETVHQGLEIKLNIFIQSNEQKSPCIVAADLYFNCATVNRLTAFLCSGVKNRLGRPVNKLCIRNCTFDNESLGLLYNFFDSNQITQNFKKRSN